MTEPHLSDSPVSTPRVSIVIPAYNEDQSIVVTLERLTDAVTLPHELLVVVDNVDDATIPVFEKVADEFPSARLLVQTYGRGPANAIRFGMDTAAAPVVVVTMADGSDDVRVIDDLVRLVERGCVVAAASRYMPGGQQIGGPRLKKLMSETAGRSLHVLAGVGTRDATNSFKAYSTEFVRRVGVESRDGFELGIELVAKARRLRLPIAEIPTVWLDRDAGTSNFQLRKWLPEYLHWYRFAYGRRLTYDDIARRPRAADTPEGQEHA
jgi:glycosyltransferase involved in cell wall biosynthesis